MNFQLIACDLITANNDNVYLTELCPGLSCARNELTYYCIQAFVNTSSTLEHGLKLIQPPQEPEPNEELLSHFARDAKKYKDYSELTQPSSNVSLVTKITFRQYFSDVIQNKQLAPHMFWMMYFRDGIHKTELADKFAIVLQKTFKRLKKKVTTLSVYPLGFACEQDKVLFWQLLKLRNSPLLVPKEIFRLSSFSYQQKVKLDAFIKGLPYEKFLIKPINANLTSGVIVIKREQLIDVVTLLVDYIKRNTILAARPLQATGLMKLPVAEDIKRRICPDFGKLSGQEQMLIDIEIHKFTNFWCKLDVHSVTGTERDFFLIEAFVAPKVEVVNASQPQDKASVASRVFLTNFNNALKPTVISLTAKATYDKNKLSSGFDFISASDNYYSYNTPRPIRQWIVSLRTQKGERDTAAKEKITQAFSNAKPWLDALLTEKVATFIEEIIKVNPKNTELLDYVRSAAITELNLEDTGFCWNCFKIKANSKFKQCTGCKAAKYCDAQCQTKDWKVYHKHECAIIQA